MFSPINQFEINRNGVSTNQDFISLIELLTQTDKESIEVGVNDKAVWSLPETALSFTSISIFLW